jgi:hypothetical protein
MLASALPLLVVAAMGSGGPLHHGRGRTYLRNATVRIEQIEHGERHLIAETTEGRIVRRVKPGVYIIVAHLRDMPGAESALPNCQSLAVRVHRHQRRVNVQVWCSTK